MALALLAFFASPTIASAGKGGYSTCCWKVVIDSSGSMLSQWGPDTTGSGYNGDQSYAWVWRHQGLVSWFHPANPALSDQLTHCPPPQVSFRCSPGKMRLAVDASATLESKAPCTDNFTTGGYVRGNDQGVSFHTALDGSRGLAVHPGLKGDYHEPCWYGVGDHAVGSQECSDVEDCHFDAFDQFVQAPRSSRFSAKGRKITPGTWTPKEAEEFQATFDTSFDMPQPHYDSSGSHRHTTTGKATTTITFTPFPPGTVAYPGRRWKEEREKIKELGPDSARRSRAAG